MTSPGQIGRAMQIGMTVGGDVLARPSSPAAIVADAAQAEKEGYATAWSVHFSRAYDALTTLAVAGTVTSRIGLGVGIVPTYPRHPLALAQQAATAQVFCGGRLTLGVGVSHRPVIEELHGLPYASPAAHMREYLGVLVPLLHGEEVHVAGEHYRVDGGFHVPGTTAVSVLVGALSPRMVRAAGERADGVITWLAGPRALGSTIVPTLHEAAAGRPAPRVVAALPVAVTDDPDAARSVAEQAFGRYNGLANYRRLFEREGVSSVSDLAVVGTEDEVATQLARYAELGVTELWPAVFGVGDDEQASVRRTRALLASLVGP
ncbi:TIGR03564 family F420-dependent LLM class oxidoreductase [Actinomycetospora endophytica]|uniref:TIGR03564 family F420-dependent LLM class oxidoreductase n=1 Tax=Actinomycetospora endophytica TaxID=2291215 RepID=A0ABS8P1W6_9PSEU|nr:TIGR03564 family F420-dependent LLM class oxidoreductase [Actinomycetospora endophytica]MCD2192079.1 TIGR03564 family F420-dependent LLM class oxidoreductase [Actinomycetospora endophytica]